MLLSIPTISFILLLNSASIMGAPSQLENTKSTLTPRQSNTPTANQAGVIKSMAPVAGASQQKLNNNTAGAKGNTPVEMSDLEKEAKEASEEKKPGINTIANAINELYFSDKYASQRHDTQTLIKMIGQVATANLKTCDPEQVSKAILAIFEPYNQANKPSNPVGTSATNTDPSPSLKTLTHSLHETWEKQITSGNPKLENSLLLPPICQAIASSSSSGDPTVVAKAIESTYAKMAAN